jgi:hypothetical protein
MAGNLRTTAILPLARWCAPAQSRAGTGPTKGNEAPSVGTIIFLVLCVGVLRALATGRPAATVRGPALEVVREWGAEVVAGARALARLDAARRAHLDRPPWGAA